MARRRKESYTHVVILLLMRCVRPILGQLVLNLVKKGTPLGRETWSIDDFLAFHKRRIEKELPVIDKYDVYKNILYPSNTQTPKTDISKWDLTLYVFVLTKICKIDHDLVYYFRQITSIREDFCKAKFPGIARDICKDYRKRLERARSKLYKQLQDDDLKKKIERRAKRIEGRNTDSAEKEKILKEWKDIEVAQLLIGETKKSGVQKYLTMKMLLSKSCRVVMQALVSKRVRDKCPDGTREWSLDSFLYRYNGRIRRRIGSLDKLGRPIDILFPKKRNTRIDEWDISLLCWVLLNVCFLEETGTADSIGEMRTIRNDIAHNNSFSLSDSDYESYIERIKKSIDTCLSFINDEDLSDFINDQVEEIERTSINKDETIRCLQMTRQNETSERQQQEKFLEVQQMILNELSTIVKKFKDIEIPECQLELMLNNCDEENENIMSKAIVKEVNEALESEQGHSSPGRNENFRRAVKKLLKRTKTKGWSFTNATKGSVLINVQCHSFDDLCELFNTCRNDGSDLYVSDVESALHCTTGIDVKLHLVMYDIEMDKCVEKIVSAVMKRTNAIASMAVNGTGNGYHLSPCSANACFAAPVPGDDLDDKLLKIKEALKNQYRVSGHSSNAMTEELRQNAIDETNSIENTCENKKLSSKSDVDERTPSEQLSSSMDCTVSDGTTTAMETEYHDVKQHLDELVVNKKEHIFTEEIDHGTYYTKALRRAMICDYMSDNKVDFDFIGIEHDCYYDECYVEPELVDLHSVGKMYDLKHKPLTEGAARIESLEDVFFHGTRPSKNIYITAEAGFGKSTLSKRLVMTWCNAHDYNKTGKNLKQSDQETMKKFEFLFFIPLREASFVVCEMDSLIYDHVIKRLPKSYRYPKTFITELLQRENTLVILDGLDEWSHSQKCEKQGDVPHKNETCHCTIITTTRPWRLSAVRPNVAIDKVIQISMLDKNMSARLASNLISVLNSRQRREKLKSYQDFEEKISLENVGDVRFVPYTLLYLVRLWFDDEPLGKSVFEILTNSIAFKAGLEERLKVKKGCDNLGKTASRRPSLERSICLLAKQQDLYALSKLAFDGVFCCKSTSKLVFDKSEMDGRILNASLEMGLLCAVNEKRFSFQHKTLQEYFAALYIHSNNEQTAEQISQSCASVTSILDKLNVILFLAHFSPSEVNKIWWQTLQPTVSNSDIAENYRKRVTVNREDISNFELLKEIQNIFVRWVKATGRTFQLEDIIIDGSFNSFQISELVRLMEADGMSVKSLHVNGASRADMLAVMKRFSNIGTLQKLSIAGTDVVYLPRVMSHSVGTLRCVSLESGLDLDFTGHFESISSDILHMLIEIRQLESLRLRHWQFTDKQLRFLFDVITSKTCMQQLLIDGLDCQTRDDFHLDLYYHQLRDLMICNTPVTQLHADVSSLKYCCFGGLAPGVETSLLAMLRNAKHLRTLNLRDILSNGRTCDSLADTLKSLFQITKRLKLLSCIIFEIDEFNIDQQTCEELSTFIDRVQKIRRPVTVILKISSCEGRCFCESMKNFFMLPGLVRVTCNADCSLTIFKTVSFSD
ncbi:uncharacterized protein LOC123537527 [Mercenaria mercenaria]|uniref:uncharacterized protein LOC123537527 n=1 Tax=Mercenaria mercenaria TaxID=6596 RepID=UPI00234ECCFE|nr:uncharacterized protein LOC123537527 [Mercenaria mercenaria]XP_045177249.2 uncharacterized protein LOC123537527 [Mercenaria mercenaria]